MDFFVRGRKVARLERYLNAKRWDVKRIAAFLPVVFLLFNCNQSSLTTTSIPPTDPFVGYTWTAVGTVGTFSFQGTNNNDSPAQNATVTYAIPLPSSTWNFTAGNNLSISTEVVSYSYAVYSDGTINIESGGNDGFSFAVSYPLAPPGWVYPTGTVPLEPFTCSYVGTYAYTVLASNHIHVSHAGYDIDLTH